MFRVLLIACCLSSFPVLADSAAAIGGLVNQRLSFMKDVAGYKAQRKRKGNAVLTVNEK